MSAPARSKKTPRVPWVPVPYTPAEARSIQALQFGDATPDQQKRALDWIIVQAASTYDAHFYPSERDTSFALGRAFVGQQIVKMLKLDVSRADRRPENAPMDAESGDGT